MLTKMQFVALVFLSFCVCASADDTVTELKPHAELKNETLAKLTDYKYYTFTVKSDYRGDEDISIRTSLTEDFPWANPDIFLSKDLGKPTLEAHSIACNSYGEDICTINKNELKAGDIWHVGVSCGGQQSRGSKCVYNIELEYIQEMLLLDGKPITIYLYEGEERIFKYFVPDDQEIKHIQISSRGKDAFSKFEMLTVKGNDPPGTDRRRHSWPAWNNGWVSRFEPGCDCFCTNCNYTTMIQADTEGYYTVTAKTSKAVEDIQSGKIYDNVFKGRTNCYSYYVSDPTNDFRVKMKVYGGDPDLYINPKSLNNQLNSFKYNSLESLESEELVVTPKMREDDQNIVGEYYICVFGRFTSSFMLTVNNDDKSSHMLESGTSESGYLENKEFINYWYREDILKEKTNITFQLHAMSGQSVLRYQLCPSTSDLEQSQKACSHTLEDMTKPIPDENHYYGIGMETIEHDPSTCNEGNSILDFIRYVPPSCIYNIGVMGGAPGIKSHYGVTIRHQEGQHQLLSEGQVAEGSLIQSQYNYYKISINDPTVISITIQLLTIHGDPDLFVAKNTEYPTKALYEKKATICGRYPDTVRYDINVADDTGGHDSLVGNYYIGVYGFIESTYHLYYHTERKHEDEEGNVEVVKIGVYLMQGKPVHGLLNSSSDFNAYKFSVNNITNDEEIVLRLIPQNGKFIMKSTFLGSNTTSVAQAGLNDHYTITYDPAKDPVYRSGSFEITVEPTGVSDLDDSGMSYTYLITYFLGSHHIPILNNQPTVGHNKDGRINYYSYSYNNDTTDLSLSITKMAGHVETYISLNSSILFPTDQDVDSEHGVFRTDQELYTINSEQMKKYCNAPDGQYCRMHIGVKSLSEEGETSYVITINAARNHTPIVKLENSIPQSGSLTANEWKYYYFKTSNSKPVYAVTVPNQGDPDVYVNIVNDLDTKQDEWEQHVPTTDKYLKKSTDSVGADIIMLTKDDLKSCGSSCVLVFGIDAKSLEAEYTFTVTRGLVLLKDKSDAFTDSIGVWGSYKFYDYYRPCTNCTTVITVNSLSNSQFSILANFNTTEKFSKHQDMDSVDFEIQGRNTLDLVITTQDLLDKGYKDEAGYFLIQIHSHSILNYTISVSSNKEKIHSIDKGMWTPYSLNGDAKNQYFVYKHNSQNGFYIRTQNDYGFANVYVKTASLSADLSKNLPDGEGDDFVWSLWDSTDSYTIKIASTDKSFCSSCYYIIQAQSYSPASGSMAIQEMGTLTNANKMTTLKIGKPVRVDFGEEQYMHFKFITPDNQPLIVDVNVLSGTIDYILSTTKIPDEYFDQYEDNDEDYGVIYRGYGFDEKYYTFDTTNEYFNANEVYYLTLRSYQVLSRGIVTVGNKGEYNHITETTPQRVKMDKTIHSFYYTLNPDIETKTRVIIETFPTNKLETFKLFASVVPANDVFKTDEASSSPEWQLDPKMIMEKPDYKLVYNANVNDKLFMSFDVEKSEADNDKVVLIAVQGTHKNPSGSLMDIYIASSDIQSLDLEMTHSGSVMNKKDMFKIYEVSIPPTTDDTYVVELDSCWGKVEMYIGRNMNDVLSGNYTSKVTHPTNGRLYSYLESGNKESKKYSIAVKSANNLTEDLSEFEWSDFSIKVRKYPSSIAHNSYIEKYYLPMDGQIEWEMKRPGEILLSWPRLKNAEGSEDLPESKVFYSVYASTETFLATTMDSACSLFNFLSPLNFEDEAELLENQYLLKLRTLERMEGVRESNQLSINILARVDEGNAHEDPNDDEDYLYYWDYDMYYPVAYRPLTISLSSIEPQGSRFGTLFIVVVVVLIAILSLCIIYFYKKYKKTKKKLDFEVREVRHADFGQEMQDKTYNRFADNEASKAD